MEKYFTVGQEFLFFSPAEARKAVLDERDVPIQEEHILPSRSVRTVAVFQNPRLLTL